MSWAGPEEIYLSTSLASYLDSNSVSLSSLVYRFVECITELLFASNSVLLAIDFEFLLIIRLYYIIAALIIQSLSILVLSYCKETIFD